MVSGHYKLEIDRHFAWFEDRLPSRPAKFIGWVRKPSSRYVRIPARHRLDLRRHLLIPAGARPVDAAARTPFVRAGCARAAEAARRDTRMG